MAEGFVLTEYFYNRFENFERGEAGFQDVFGDWLFYLDPDKEKKRAEAIQFASNAAPEVVRASNREQAQPADLAEQRLRAGDLAGAQKLAQQALQEKQGDPARALFVLARAATLGKDMNGARTYFERTLEVAREPRLVAWSHIYLGRIYDLQENRETALQHYRAALQAGDNTSETRTAAERGLKQPYEPPVARQRQNGQPEDKN
jgi:tetratricopeptide (TPR) repeat protein